MTFGPQIIKDSQTQQVQSVEMTKEEKEQRQAEIDAAEIEDIRAKHEVAEDAYVNAVKDRETAEQLQITGDLDQSAVDRYLAVETQRKQELDNTPQPSP